MHEYLATVERVVDGDTLNLRVDLGFRVSLEVVCRLSHLNAPEESNWTPGGLVDDARTFVQERIQPGQLVVVRTTKTEKYGRWLAEVFYLRGETNYLKILESGKNLNQEMLDAGVAAPYEGGKRN